MARHKFAYGLLKRIAMAAALVGLVTACDTPRPQAARGVTSPLDADARAKLLNRGPFVSSGDRERLGEADAEDARIRHGIRVLGQDRVSASKGFGFVGPKSYPYQVFRDGSAFLYPKNVGEIPLDGVLSRVHQVVLGGWRDSHILAFSHNGTQMAWNARNLSQQTVIRPQASTFGRVKSYDVVETHNTPYLVQAVEGNRIEKWNLISGNRTSWITIPGDQPRALLDNTQVNSVIYGTQSGAVGVWHNGHTHTKYSHQGPVLEIASNAKQTIIASASKDGTVMVYDEAKNTVRTTLNFPSAVYRVQVECGGRYVLALPTIGVPTLFDLSTDRRRTYDDYDAKDIREAEFLCAQEKMLLRTRDGTIARWDLKHGFFEGKLVPFVGRSFEDMAIHVASGTMLLQTNLNQIEVWDLNPMRFRTVVVRSQHDLQNTEISNDGKLGIGQSIDGLMIEYRVPKQASQPYVWIAE